MQLSEVKSPARGKEQADNSRDWELRIWKAAWQKNDLRVLMSNKLTMSQQRTLVFPSQDPEALFYSVGGWTLARVVQRSCEIFRLRDVKNVNGHNPGKSALGISLLWAGIETNCSSEVHNNIICSVILILYHNVYWYKYGWKGLSCMFTNLIFSVFALIF